jgi:hypothetical protein
LSLSSEFLVSKFAFKCNWYRYTPAGGCEEAEAEEVEEEGGVHRGYAMGKQSEEEEEEGLEVIVGATPLLRAAEFGHLATVLHLLERGADPTAERAAESGGGTGLHGAAERGHAEVVEALVSALAARGAGGGGDLLVGLSLPGVTLVTWTYRLSSTGVLTAK